MIPSTVVSLDGTSWSIQQQPQAQLLVIAQQQQQQQQRQLQRNQIVSSNQASSSGGDLQQPQCHKMTDQREQQQQQSQSQAQQQQQQQQQHHQNKSHDEPRTNLIINYLPQNMNEKELYSLFVTIGPVESCRVMKDYKTGYSYGFGFVNYAKAEDAATAISTLNGLQVQNKRLKVSFARPSGEEIKETNLYVTNLPRNITESQIDEIFSKFGNIVQKNILKDKLTGLPRGVAFVRFDKREEAQEAIAQLHGTIPDGGSEPLSVKIAEEHGKQKAAYYAGWQAGYNQSRVTHVCNMSAISNTPRNDCIDKLTANYSIMRQHSFFVSFPFLIGIRY
ncbi:sex-lethal homolog isoform X2 [Cataglyphis hispanica]|uniref:sex-lethal homolog isoform X2 n=1 Tax=Cataglyphis hispanica TaxID=1086592 RepID=UPI00217FC824|nr:sex-lethal homolog isoform X2 [Cataglyphis hispanica]